MAYKEKSGVYHYDFRKDGVRHRGSTGVRRKADAIEIESALRISLAKNKFGLKQSVPVSAIPRFDVAMAEFLTWSELEHQEKPATARRHRISSVALLRYFEYMRLDRIDAAAVEGFKDWRRVQKAKPKKVKRGTPAPTGQIKPATVNRELACLRALFYYFKRHRSLPLENPVSGVKMLAEDRNYFVLSHEQEAKYLSECSLPLYHIAILLIETGMRPEEVYSMRFENVHSRDRYYFNPKGKTKSARRRIPLTDRALAIINERFEEAESEFVFPGERPGRHLVKINAGHTAAVKRSGLPRFRIYDLRHTFATRFIEAGGDLRTLADILGHKDLRMVMTYSHPTDPHKRHQIEQFQEYNRQRQVIAGDNVIEFPALSQTA